MKIKPLPPKIIFLGITLFAAGVNTHAAVPPIKKVMIVVLENESRDNSLKQPFMGQLARSGGYLAQMFGLARPSQPNYIALTSGSTENAMTNGKIDLDVSHIGDLLEAQGKSWKVYADDYPGGCFQGETYKGYARKHNPFISYRNVQQNPRRCARIVNSNELQRDVQSETLPDYSFFIPSMSNSGHDTNTKYADQWLSRFFWPLLQSSQFMKDMLFILTFDEGAKFGDQAIYTVFYGEMVKAGSQSSKRYDHYSVLRTIEQGMGLGSLDKRDATASVIDGIWK